MRTRIDPPLLPHLTERGAAALILLASVAILGAAFAFEHLGGLRPCPLCILERYPYGVAILLSLIALGGWGGRRAGIILLALSGIVFFTGATIAAYHVGVEQGWFEGLSACQGESGGTATTIEELKALLLTKPPVPCDVVPWSLFGISLAGYDALSFLALAAFSLYTAARRARQPRR
jgi:disulfide bond formation protein DsbB